MSPHKRLIVACDGTWVNSDNGFEKDSWLPWKTEGHLATPSNVTRLCRALLTRSTDGVQQVVYYQGGLGSNGDWYSHLVGGLLGEGISENIREAYAFLCNNYELGDEIILVGFSRGAFTARSIGGLISSIGLLTKRGLGAFYPIFKDWENQANAKYKPQDYQSSTWPLKGRPKFKDPEYLRKLVGDGLTRPDIPIKAIGVWDTVGTLGIPAIKILGIPIHTDSTVEYSFVNTQVAANVEYAYQALALDEVRNPFYPTIWEWPDQSTTTSLKLLKQTWFPGVHTSVGGGYSDTSISDITLAWMITQLSRHLSFDPTYVPRQREQNVQFYKHIHVPVRPWAMGLIQRSDKGLMGDLAGRSVRTPGQYHPTDPDTGKQLPRKLVDTCEFIHPSVRYRIEQHGFGVSNNEKNDSKAGDYHPAALQGFRWVKGGEKECVEVGGEQWAQRGMWIKEGKDGNKVFIVEDEIGDDTAEMELVKGWKDDDILGKLYPVNS